MEIKEFEKQIALIKEKAIDNVDKHFNEFIINDINIEGVIEYLIGEDDWYNYYVNLCRDINDLIYDIVNSEINDEKKHEILFQCVAIKRIIDKNILSNPTYNEDTVKFDIFDFDIKKFREEIKNKDKENQYIEVLGNKEEITNTIKKLYGELYNIGFLNCSFDEFANHFKPNSFDINLTKWHSTESRIVALFDLLIKEKIISPKYKDNKYQTISQHFINKHGKLFKPKQLSIVTSKREFTKEEYKEINLIVDNLKKVSTS